MMDPLTLWEETQSNALKRKPISPVERVRRETDALAAKLMLRTGLSVEHILLYMTEEILEIEKRTKKKGARI